MPTITPCLWFDPATPDTSLEAALDFYPTGFPDSSVESVYRRPGDEMLLSANFTLAGNRFCGVNGGPQFRFTAAVSFQIECADQAEVDYYWDALLVGGRPSKCGWLEDRFGLSWQVVPRRLFELIYRTDGRRAHAAAEVMMTMQKFVIADLEAGVDRVIAAD